MSVERFTLDTNILVYCVDARDIAKRDLALTIMEAAVILDCPLALQAIGEFYAATTAKLKLPAQDARARAHQLMSAFEMFAHSANAVRIGMEEASLGKFSLWDGVLLASAAEAGCTVILSEDMQDGARLGSIAICNPFGPDGLSARAQEALGL